MLGLAVAAAALLLVVALAALAGAVRARGAAQGAADLAALAAAELVTGQELRGVPDQEAEQRACGLAAVVASRNGARVASCRALRPRTVEVATIRQVSGWGEAHGVARAGPRP